MRWEWNSGMAAIGWLDWADAWGVEFCWYRPTLSGRRKTSHWSFALVSAYEVAMARGSIWRAVLRKPLVMMGRR